MTVLVPSMAYSGVVMTENAFYPVFLLSILFIARGVRRPTLGRQAVALLGLGLVAFTRVQGLALVGAYLLAIVIYALTGPSAERRSYLRRFTPTAMLLLVASLAPVLASVARGDGLLGWLGPRSGTFHEFHPGEIPEWFAYLTADLVLYVALVPFAATVIVIGQGLVSRTSERMRLFAAVALPTFAAMLGSVAAVSASVDVDGTENLNERYVFYVIPLMFVGLGLWVREGMLRRRPWGPLVIAACCLLVMVLPIDRLRYNAGFQSAALLPWLGFSVSRSTLALIVGLFVFGCGILWLTCRTDRVGRLWLLVGAWMALLGVLMVGSNHSSAGKLAHAFDGISRTWVDDAAAHRRVVIVWDESVANPDFPDQFGVWMMVTEFFNEHVGDVYRLGQPTYYESVLPTVAVAQKPDGTVVDGRGRPIEAPFVLSSCRTPVIGDVVASAPRHALQLTRVHGPIRLSRASGCSRPVP
jgi:hypothetical protein